VSTSALITGKLWRAPEARTSSKTYKPFFVANIREGVGEQATWSSVTAFAEAADDLLKLETSDAISIRGPFTAEVYAKDGTPPHVSFRIIIDRVASPRLTKRKEGA
jgi:hypothetical protein